MQLENLQVQAPGWIGLYLGFAVREKELFLPLWMLVPIHLIGC